MTLEQLGWTAREAEAFEPFATRGLRPARVIVGYGAAFRVYVDGEETLAEVSGRLRHDARTRRDLPAVGDWVAVRRNATGARATIQAILPRKSVFSRKAAGQETVEQMLAANVDTAFLVSGLDRDYNLRRIERYLAMTRESGAVAVIVLNKADLVDDVPDRVREVTAIAGGAPVHAISSKLREGLEALTPYLRPGQTVALLGSSGVGKSTLINQLLGVDRQVTCEVREADQRGRHTTTYRELVPLPSGALLIDTPGMRELQLWESSEPAASAFTDIASLAEGCRFRDCRHLSEPGCAVGAAAAAGTLSPARLESFRKLQDEQAVLATQQDERARIEQKRAGRKRRG